MNSSYGQTLSLGGTGRTGTPKPRNYFTPEDETLRHTSLFQLDLRMGLQTSNKTEDARLQN